jgi:hypothetical protein
VLVGFEYLTDQGYSARGFAFDDFEIPEIGLFDDSESESPDGWQANGWVRVDAPIPQTWELRRVDWFADRPAEVTVIEVGEDGSATVDTSFTATRSVLVIAPTAPRTLERAPYQMTVR